MTVRDPLSSSDLNPIRIKPVPYSQISQTYPMNTCVELKRTEQNATSFVSACMFFFQLARILKMNLSGQMDKGVDRSRNVRTLVHAD